MAGRLTIVDRELIYAELTKNRFVKWTEVAERVGCDRSTVSREVARNGGREAYSVSAAQARAEQMLLRPRPPKLATDVELARRVRKDLKDGFSPAGTARRLAAEGFRVSHETIYQAVYSGLIGLDPTECLRTRRPGRRRRKKDLTTNPKGNYLGDFRSIWDRPGHVDERRVIGNWEGDLISGCRAQSHLITLYERVCRLTHLIALPDGKASRHVIAALDDWYQTLPAHLRLTLTWDQGSELARWDDIDYLFEDGIYFADKRSPWQRGGNEHNNRQLRFWFPRNQTVADPTGERIQQALGVLNHQPRRSLNWQTPHHVYHHHTVH